MRSLHLAAAVSLLSVAAGCAETQTTPTDDLDVDLSMKEGAVTADVTITNVSDHDLKLLSWYLPDADLQEPLFMLERDGQPVRYTGPIYKRAQPDASDYVTLVPGEAITRSVDLSKFYDMSKGGEYTVVVRLDNTRLLNTTGLIDSSSVHFEAARIEQAAPTRPPKVTCSAEQTALINQALPLAGQYASEAATYLAGTPSATTRYTTWFGAFDAAGWSTAKTHFDAIANAFATKPVTFDCSCKQKNVYAFVNPNQPYLITVCGAFWTAPTGGKDSKAGTMVHEMSHFTAVAGTNDYAYGQTACKQLAIDNPTQALNNADSHEYFAENTPAL